MNIFFQMVSPEVWDRAKTLLKRKLVIPVNEMCCSTFYQFLVQQRTGEWCNVYLVKHRKGWRYACTAIRRGEWSCSMFKGDKSKPFCSHTLAIDLYLKNKGVVIG